MNAKQAKQAARAWVHVNLSAWPGLCAAHLVGGVTTMPDETPFPAHKDVDLHLVFAEGSPALQPEGPFSGILAAHHGGVAIEAGIKSVAEYASPEAVLGNPEIAHHLTLDSVLYDPDGLLRALQDPVRRDYPRRRWVLARVEHERKGLAGALALRPVVREAYGASGEVNILGYTTSFATAALQVAAIQPPKMGSRTVLRLGEALAAHGRLDLYEEILGALGLTGIGAERVAQVVDEAAEAFDVAIDVKRTGGPFQHKLHRHLRPYLVDSCRAMLAEGHHRAALAWAIAVHLGTSDVILAGGTEDDKARFAARQAGLLSELGLDTTAARDAAYERARLVYDRVFALADQIVANHPGIVD